MPGWSCSIVAKNVSAWRIFRTNRRNNRGFAPALFDDLVGASDQRRRQVEPQRPGRFQIDEQLQFGGLVKRDVARFCPAEDLMDIIGKTLGEFAKVRRVAHQSAQIDIVAVGIDHRETVFSGQFGDQGAVRQKAAAFVNHGRIELLLRHLGKAAAEFGIVYFGKKIPGQRDPQMLRRVAVR